MLLVRLPYHLSVIAQERVRATAARRGDAERDTVAVTALDLMIVVGIIHWGWGPLSREFPATEPGDDAVYGGTSNGPDFKVTVANDVLFVLDAFAGGSYPFAPGDLCNPG